MVVGGGGRRVLVVVRESCVRSKGFRAWDLGFWLTASSGRRAGRRRKEVATKGVVVDGGGRRVLVAELGLTVRGRG